MVAFSRAFLIGSRRITLKDACSEIILPVIFDCSWIGKFRAVICKTNLEKSHKPVRAKFQIQPFKDVDNRLGIIMFPKESEHEFSFNKVNGQKNLSTFFAFYRIKLNYRKVGMF